MPRALVATGMELEYDTFGSPGDPAMLLIAGLGAQLTFWEERFCQTLAEAGRFVIRFDNRDVGLSTKLDGQEPDVGGAIAAAYAGEPPPPLPYVLSDMAADSIGLLDGLGIDQAHIIGASLGGMIAQVMAVDFPDRVHSLTSIMSQPGDTESGQPTPEAAVAIFTPPPPTREAYIESASQWMIWRSRKYGELLQVQEVAARDFDRSFYPEGAGRQVAAMFGAGQRSETLKNLAVPTLVIHGRDDTLITPSGGFLTAELIPGAHMLYLADMGHDLPEPLWPVLVNAIVMHTSLAASANPAALANR